MILFSIPLLLSTSVFAATSKSSPCNNGVDGVIVGGQFGGWACSELGDILIGPGQGYCAFPELAIACCKCWPNGGIDGEPTAYPSTGPEPNDPTSYPSNVPETARPTASDPTAYPTNIVTDRPTSYPDVVTGRPTNEPQPDTQRPTNEPETQRPTNEPETQRPTNEPETQRPTTTPPPSNTPPPSDSNPGDTWNVCYYTNWARYRGGLINHGEDIFESGWTNGNGFDAHLCTHFMYGFVFVTQDFDLVASDPNADHPGLTQPCDVRCNDPNFTTDWEDPNGLRCDWPCNPKRKMRGYEAINVEIRSRNPNIKSLVSVGGWNFNDCAASPADTAGQGSATCEIFSTIAKSDELIRKFAKNIMAFCDKWGFDGFDLDWEYPVAAGHNRNLRFLGDVYEDEISDYADYITMLRILREEFHKANPENPLLLTAAVGVGKGTVDTAYDIGKMALYLDQINLMTYDMHGAWEARTGCNAPLFATEEDIELGGGVGAGTEVKGYPLSVSWAIDYWIQQGARPDQLTVGLGSYGRGWKLADPVGDHGYNAAVTGAASPGPSTQADGYLAYYEIMDLIRSGKATRHYDYERQCPYIVTDDGEWFGYDDVESLKAKTDYLKTHNVRGVMWWALDLDDFTGEYHNGQKYPLINFVNNEMKDYHPHVPKEVATSGCENGMAGCMSKATVTPVDNHFQHALGALIVVSAVLLLGVAVWAKTQKAPVAFEEEPLLAA